MARSRNIKPGFFQNEDLTELDFATRLLFIGLWTEADKSGRLEDRPKRLRIALFPADDVDMEAMLAALAKYGFISRYERDDKQVIQIVKWDKHQNPHKKETPSALPPEHGELEGESDDAPTQDVASMVGFDSFWKCYPRKTAKQSAEKAWGKLNPSVELQAKLATSLAAHCVSADWLKDGGQFIPHPATWLNGKRWEDEVKPAGNVHAFPGQSRHHGLAERFAAEDEREDGTHAF